MGLIIKNKEIDDVINYKHFAIENLLKKIYQKINKIKTDSSTNNYDINSNSSKDQFYRAQILDRDNHIEELKIKLKVNFFITLI